MKRFPASKYLKGLRGGTCPSFTTHLTSQLRWKKKQYTCHSVVSTNFPSGQPLEGCAIGVSVRQAGRARPFTFAAIPGEGVTMNRAKCGAILGWEIIQLQLGTNLQRGTKGSWGTDNPGAPVRWRMHYLIALCGRFTFLTRLCPG